VPPPIVLGQAMPDLRGTPKRLLLPLLSIPGLQVSISGEGFVVQQEPPPGTPLESGASIRLRLE
jgi:cell division protein FtsI (penicillin-binding protein 3)